MNILELANQIGLNPKWVASTSGGEYHSPCPVCGGTDRFFIQPYRQMSKCLGSYRCRQCGIYGDSIKFGREFLGFSFAQAFQDKNIFPNKISLFNTTNFSKPASLRLPPKQWISKATDLVNSAQKNLLNKQPVLNFLESRGIPLDAVKRYKLGWLDENQFFSRSDWGLQEDPERSKKLWMPKGLLIPTVEKSGDVVRLKIRRYDWQEGDSLPKYVAVSGSMNGLSLIGSSKHETIIVVESELDGYAINNVADDFALVVAVGSNIKNPDNLTHSHVKRSKHLLIAYDNDEAGEKMLAKWKKLYSHAKGCPVPIGKDIGEAIQSGLNIKDWLLTKLSQE